MKILGFWGSLSPQERNGYAIGAAVALFFAGVLVGTDHAQTTYEIENFVRTICAPCS